MRTSLSFLIALTALTFPAFAASGCTITSFDATASGGGGVGSATDPGTPVKAQPLAGNIDGKPFVARVAIANRGAGGSISKFVTIYASDATCDNQPQLADDAPQIFVDVDAWTDGNSFELGLSTHTLTFELVKNGNPDNLIVATGRVEVTSAGAPATHGSLGTPGTLSVRGIASQSGAVEGQVPVVVCAQ